MDGEQNGTQTQQIEQQQKSQATQQQAGQQQEAQGKHAAPDAETGGGVDANAYGRSSLSGIPGLRSSKRKSPKPPKKR